MKKQTQPLKTNIELLAELPEPFRQKALGNCTGFQASKFPIEENTVAEALLCSFVWSKTVEGYKYWEDVHLFVSKP